MFVKIVREIWTMGALFNVQQLSFCVPFLQKGILQDLKETSTRAKQILSELRDTSVEELKKDETYSDTIEHTHTMIFDLEDLLWDNDFSLQGVNKSEVKKVLNEIYKNVQKIYLIITENFTQEDKKKYIKNCIDTFKRRYEKTEGQIALYIGKGLIRKNICSNGLPKTFITLKGDELVETIMKLVSEKDPANEFDYVIFFEEIENELRDEQVKWAMKELA